MLTFFIFSKQIYNTLYSDTECETNGANKTLVILSNIISNISNEVAHLIYTQPHI